MDPKKKKNNYQRTFMEEVGEEGKEKILNENFDSKNFDFEGFDSKDFDFEGFYSKDFE